MRILNHVRLQIQFAFALSAGFAAADPCDYEGGMAARFPGDECPVEAPVTCGKGGAQVRCCPGGFECTGANTKYCCPPGIDCSGDVNEAAQCPDPSWKLWGSLGSTSWCCTWGYTGYWMDGGGVACLIAVTQLEDFNSTTPASLQTPTTPATCRSSGVGSKSPLPVLAANYPTITAGSIAGIVIGAVAFISLILLGVFLVCRRRRQNPERYDVPSDALSSLPVGSWADTDRPYQNQRGKPADSPEMSDTDAFNNPVAYFAELERRRQAHNVSAELDVSTPTKIHEM